MYWEQVYEMYEYACNMNILEKNEKMRFDFMLHAQTKEAQNSWRDLPIPYPDRNWNPPDYDTLVKDKDTLLPPELAGKVAVKREKATPAQRKRAELVRAKFKQHKEEVRKLNEAYAYKKYYK